MFVIFVLRQLHWCGHMEFVSAFKGVQCVTGVSLSYGLVGMDMCSVYTAFCFSMYRPL